MRQLGPHPSLRGRTFRRVLSVEKGGFHLPGASGLRKHCLPISAGYFCSPLNFSPQSLVLGILSCLGSGLNSSCPDFGWCPASWPTPAAYLAGFPSWACPLRPQLRECSGLVPPRCAPSLLGSPCPAPRKVVAWNWPFAILFSAHLLLHLSTALPVLPVT